MGWTEDEKQKLIDNYPSMSNVELMELLNKTEGQIRNMKSSLGLRGKFKPFTNEEKELIRTYYLEHINEIDLDELATRMNRQKTSISRFARKEGLTNQNRSLTESAKENVKHGIKNYLKSDRYTSEIHQQQVELLNYYAQNQHPRGMLGKHHNEDTCKRMSKSHFELASNMTYEEKHEIAMKAVKTKRENGTYMNTTSNAYSRTNGGRREDLDNCYFRSAWEANVARILNHLNIKWEYEPKRFFFIGENLEVLSYQPDFYLPEFDKWIEVKGWWDKNSKERLRLFAEQYSEENKNLIVIDESFYNLLRCQYFSLSHWEDKYKSTKPYRNNYFEKLNEKQQIYLTELFLYKE